MAFPNSCPALRLRAAAAVVAVWARPGAIRPGRGSAGCPLAAVSVPPLRPVRSRGAPGGAPSPAADRRAVPPFRARFRRAPPGRSARRSALRAPAPVLSACPPRGFCSFDGVTGRFPRACGAARLRFALHSLRSFPRWRWHFSLCGAPPQRLPVLRVLARRGSRRRAVCQSVVSPDGLCGVRRRRGGVGWGTLSPARLPPLRGHPAPPGRVWAPCTRHGAPRGARGLRLVREGMIRAGLVPRLAFRSCQCGSFEPPSCRSTYRLYMPTHT